MHETSREVHCGMVIFLSHSRMWYVQCHDEEQIQTTAFQMPQKVHVGYVKHPYFAASGNYHI